MKTLIVVDMQNDFIDGSLGTEEAKAIVPNVVDKINDHNGPVIYTKDTHYGWYLNTLEGKKLPIKHCIIDTHGWKFNENIDDTINDNEYVIICKETFGADWKGEDAKFAKEWFDLSDEIELVGLCTDICVVSNALILRAMYPNKKISIDASCCAGTTPDKHKAALEVMKSCQIDVIGT